MTTAAFEKSMSGELADEAVVERLLAGMSAEERIVWTWRTFGSGLAFASSFGLEDQVLTDMIAKKALPLFLFTLDTGRLFQETYDLIDQTRRKYGLEISVFFPDATEVEALVGQHGPNLFRESIALRKACCATRKLGPLRRALRGRSAWITGLRREQSITREDVPFFQRDANNGLFKINPLTDWSLERVWDYVRSNRVPYNPLHDEGFPSIGCACCTRAVGEGEDVRAGRWWWENPEHKECGLHRKPRS